MQWKMLSLLAPVTMGLALCPDACFAHALLLSAYPQDGATVPSGVIDIELRFNSRIDAKLSRLTLFKAGEQRVAQPLETISALEGLKQKRQHCLWEPILSNGKY